MKVAMVGNPNVGKTAILNALTSGSFIVGNYPGTTVEIKSGKAKIDGKEVAFIDLPGIYSFTGYSKDESVVKEYFEGERPDLILNVINAANLERGLYITLRAMSLDIPMVVALNMIDEAESRGIFVDDKKLSEILGVPVVKTVATDGRGVEQLKKEILKGGRTGKIRVGGEEIEIVKLAERIARGVILKKRVKGLPVLDEALTDPYLSIPVFLSVMWMVFRFTYDVAAPLVTMVDVTFSTIAEILSSKGGIFTLLGDGVITGVGSVLVFLPNIMFLFIAMAFLELSGYLPRAVFALERIMFIFVLSVISFIPMILGFGCNVPAVMAARSIEDRKTRLITTLIVPFMPCSARLPIFVLIAGVFFTGMESIAIMAMYLFGLTTALISALLLRRLVLKGEAEYIMELPPFRRPKATDIWNLTWARTKHFLVKAGTVILAMSVVIWYLTNYPSENVSQSYAGMLGKLITPLFSPLGWGWEISVAIIMGFVAKEIVIETFGILLGDAANITSLMTLPQAFAFMVFVSLYVPCMATIATIKAETGGWKYALFSVGYSTAVAYVIALLAFKILEVVL